MVGGLTRTMWALKLRRPFKSDLGWMARSACTPGWVPTHGVEVLYDRGWGLPLGGAGGRLALATLGRRHSVGGFGGLLRHAPAYQFHYSIPVLRTFNFITASSQGYPNWGPE